MPLTSQTSTPTGTGARIVGKGSATAAGPGPDVMAASTLDSDRVMSSDGEEVGKIKEIMLDVQGGRVAYAVMASGGFLGIGNKLLAIPWSALTLDTSRKCFLLNVSAERVKEAPGFDKDQWPTMADLSWATTLHEYYGTQPYWDDPAVLDMRALPDDPDAPETKR
ncbi:PRC-barrel domain-containing protein [Paraburkholderia acidipaludis]|uniref:PRC-barrel domain-containing protein n=1 Tax=Paraburkholderia acidipaludis TaxID=660537 RepID=UPI0005BC6342|nr:PRC-barrel domain-containing protein [Paraburkholderia acidipaludis]